MVLVLRSFLLSRLISLLKSSLFLQSPMPFLSLSKKKPLTLHTPKASLQTLIRPEPEPRPLFLFRSPPSESHKWGAVWGKCSIVIVKTLHSKPQPWGPNLHHRHQAVWPQVSLLSHKIENHTHFSKNGSGWVQRAAPCQGLSWLHTL